MTDDVPASQRWRGRPVHSLLLQAFVFAIPIVASVSAATAVSMVGPRPGTPLEFVAWWAVLTAIALAVLAVVDRVARKLLPLATLLKLSMLFPDRAPSRFRVARNAASVRKLQETLAAARTQGATAEPVWAAETILTLITALGHHDRRSRGHSERVHVYAELIADELDLDQDDRDRLRWAALLHDVGKLVVPAELLNKPGTPDEQEWEALRMHPQAGADLCRPLLPWLGEWGAAIAQHHEWYDGSGYPLGLRGLEISRAARIVAVADCYEVMTTSRTYKPALNPAAARQELARCAGTQFDPAIVRAFLNISLGRLRLAMGPLAMLSTVPSMARLAGVFESLAPVARAGAVVGGAALMVGGTSFLPGMGGPSALPAEAASRPATPIEESTTIVLSDVHERLTARRDLPAPVVATDDEKTGATKKKSGKGTAPAGDEDIRTSGGGTSGGDAPATKRAREPVEQPTGEGAPKPDTSPTRTTKTPEREPEPARASSPKKRDTGRGANPVPPTYPPGLEDEKPDGPPPNPQPPRNDRAEAKGF